MKHFTLKQLQYFEAVARFGHFGRAASASSISQPAISVQIKELEQAVGAPLFERGGREIRLTSFGREFATRVRSILLSIEDLQDFTRMSRHGFVGHFKLGIIPTIAPYLLPSLIANLSESHAQLDLNIRETLTDNLLQELRDGRLDAAIVALPLNDAALEEVPLFDEEFILVRSAAEGNYPPPERGMLKEMRLLLLEEGHCFRDQALSFCKLRPAVPRNGMEGSSLSTLVQMVASGIGVTLIPEMAVKVETRSADVSISRFKSPKPKRTIGMVWRKTSPLADQFLSISEVVKTSGLQVCA